MVGFLVVIITLVIGIPLGAVAGYFGGWIDNLLMRITDAMLALPALLVLILLSAILREIEGTFGKIRRGAEPNSSSAHSIRCARRRPRSP